MVRALIAFVLAGAALILRAEESVSDSEIWNEGVSFYEQGDITNALRVLKPLMLSKSHGPRAAEVVAKLEFERGERENAANAAQIALRAHPKDARANRNFTRATDGLLEVRRAKHIEGVLAGAKGKDPGALLKAATCEARSLFDAAGTYRTNSAPRAVALADRYALRAKALADTWIPVREAICAAVTNEEQSATILAQLEDAEKRTQAAARALEDLSADAYELTGSVEHDLTRFLKLVAMPPLAIDEGIIAQSNAWMDAATINDRSWQQDALDYTRAFRAKFPMWARAYEQQQQADTNRPPFTAESQAKISAYATEVEKLQLECVEKSIPPSQERALELLHEIKELLPKDQNGQQNSDQPQPNNEQKNEPQNNEPQKNDEPQQNEPQNNEPQNNEPQQDESQANEDENQAEREQDAELDAILKKAQERNDEHEAEKRARMRKAKLPPNERDW